jgi:3-oxoacyl-[acyl-carrier-protein] synthase III
MSEDTDEKTRPEASFFKRAGVVIEKLPIRFGIPFGFERVTNSQVGIGGAYGSWGESIDNQRLPDWIEENFGEAIPPQEQMELASLGFEARHHVPPMSPEETHQLEVQVGSRILREAASACGWKPGEVEAVLLGSSAPVTPSYLSEIASQAGIRQDAILVDMHKACDGAVGALHLAINPDLPTNQQGDHNLALELRGKKALIGGIEGLSRFVEKSHDRFAYQLFGNGAAVIGLVLGESMKALIGRTHEVYDEEGVLAVRMDYPHSHQHLPGKSLVEFSMEGQNHLRFAGLMHEPPNGLPIAMTGPMGMVKLFVRTGVGVVREVYLAYQDLMNNLGNTEMKIRVKIAHQANLKINTLKEKHLQNEGIHIPTPWLLSDFGNVSAASALIAFLRQLPSLRPGDHIMVDGFGAGTYYDVFVAEMGG